MLNREQGLVFRTSSTMWCCLLGHLISEVLVELIPPNLVETKGAVLGSDVPKIPA
jgi:hypothetical protein